MCKAFGRICKSFMASNRNDLRNPHFYRGVLAEGIGTLVLVFIGCGSCIGKHWADFAPTQVHISLCFGLAVATVVWCIGHVSGGHVNPAVTLGMLVTRKISLVRAVVFVTAQCLGAIAGSGLLRVLTPADVQGNLGMTEVDAALRVEQGFGVELMITFILVFTVFASCDSKRTDLNGSAPLSIGLCVTLCHLFAIKYTGSSMNPARTFGPAVITGTWDNHWVYWCGPLCGGVVAALLYDVLFASDASLTKARYFLLTSRSEERTQTRAGGEEAMTSEERAKMQQADERI